MRPAVSRAPATLRRVLLTGTLLAGLAVGAPAAHAADDYPWSGQGQCPLAPPPQSHLDAVREHERLVARQPELLAAHRAALEAHRHALAEHQPGEPPVGPAPVPPPALPPPPAEPAPTCARNVWFLNGSMGDPWGFALRHCTSFVAWRLRETNGAADFHNRMAGGHFSNAENWDENARALGFLVDDVPAVGAVAQTDAGVYGHVAWVSAVGDGTVTVEEYNHGAPGTYGTRTVPASEFRYIHVDDVAPAPSLGPDRPATAVVTPAGDTVRAAVTEAGDLVVTGLPGHAGARRLGTPGAFTPLAAPALAVDLRGRVTVAVVIRDGRLLVGRVPRSDRHAWRPTVLGAGWAPTASPALHAVSGDLRLVGVTAAGALRERRTTSAGGRWSGARTLPTRAAVSTHAAPAVATDGTGETWLASVSRAGVLEVRRATSDGWARAQVVDDREWSVASSPALTTTSDGRVWLHAVSVDGDLVTSVLDEGEWTMAEEAPGTWSPWSSPAVAVDPGGRMWRAGVSHGGRLVVQQTTGTGEWDQPRTLGAAGLATSPALVVGADGAVMVGQESQALDRDTTWHRLVRPLTSAWRGGAARS